MSYSIFSESAGSPDEIVLLFSESGGSPDGIVLLFSESGGSPDEIVQFGLQMPRMENAVKHLYAVAVDQCNKYV